MNLYGFFFALGTFIGLLLFLFLIYKYRLPQDKIIEKICLVFVISLIGARLAYITLYPSQFSSFWEIFAIWQGGLVSYGGIIFGIATSLYIFRGPNLLLSLDLLTPSFFTGWIFGRIGGFLTQNAVGQESNFYGQFFYNRVPTQLFESVLAFMLIIISLLLLNRPNRIKQHMVSGNIFLLNLALYCLGRFLIDFWRQDPSILAGLELGQIISLTICLICCIILIVRFQKRSKT